MVIDSRKVPAFQQQQQAMRDLTIDTAAVATQVEILMSENVSLAVIKDLKLTEDPEFVGHGAGLIGALSHLITSTFDSGTAVSEFELERRAIAAFESRRKVTRVPLTYVMEISFRSLDRGKAAQIANAIGDAYITHQRFEKGNRGMPNGKDYVVFGQGDFFGDITDIIHCLGGRLKKLVLNVAEPTSVGRMTPKERLSRLPYPVEIEQLTSFIPEKDEEYALGFVGLKREPLVRSLQLRFTRLIHPSAFVSPTATIGGGVIINAGAIVAPYVTIEDHVMINRAASVGHDTYLEQYAVVNPGAHIAGSVRIGYGSVVSIGASVIQGRRVGKQALIAAGAVVLEDVPDYALVAGVPAVVKRSTKE